VYRCVLNSLHGSLKPELPRDSVFIEEKSQSSLSSIVEVDGREEEESSFLSTSVLIPPSCPSHH
jgi:hypothetical protein